MTKVAIQLFSVSQEMAKDPIATIEQVARAGYRYLEVANHNTQKDTGIGFGVPAHQLKEMLDRLGIQIISAHLDPFDQLDALSEYQLAIGNHNVVYSRDFYHNRQEVLDRAYWLNKTGEACAKRGLTLHYHNHFHEYLELEGESIWDTLMNNTDPSLVKVQLDTFWVLRAGLDPVEIMQQLGDRVTMIHQKDYAAGYQDKLDMTKLVQPGQYIDRSFYDQYECPETFVEIGTGIIDIQAIIDQGNRTGAVEYIILEQDHSKYNQLESIRISKKGFEKYTGVQW